MLSYGSRLLNSLTFNIKRQAACNKLPVFLCLSEPYFANPISKASNNARCEVQIAFDNKGRINLLILEMALVHKSKKDDETARNGLQFDKLSIDFVTLRGFGA